MNIFMYCLSSVSGGAVAYLRNLALLLSELFAESSEGHQLKFLAHEEQRELLEGIDERQIVWVRGERPTGQRRLWWEWRNIGRIVEEEKPDILFTPYQIGPRVRGIKQVLMLRNMEPFLFMSYRYMTHALGCAIMFLDASRHAHCARPIALSPFHVLRRTIWLGKWE